MKFKRQYRNCLKVFQNLNSKHLIFVALFVIILYTFMVFHSCYNKDKSEIQLKKNILVLSQQYVNELANNQQNVVDGPYSGRFTGYDLKKTFAVLLQNMLERINNLEKTVGNKSLHHKNQSIPTLIPYGNKNRLIKSKFDYKEILKGAQDDCNLSLEDKLKYPECDEKIDWMRKHWKTHICYKNLGVDGSLCSIIIYLSEVETFCPVLRFRLDNFKSTVNQTKLTVLPAEINTNITELYDKLSTLPKAVALYMTKRISINFKNFVISAIHLNKTLPNFYTRKRKEIPVFIGYLMKSNKFDIAEKIFKGGPLGELVQWTDLIMGLFVLGHQITVFNEVSHIPFKNIPEFDGPCQIKKGFPIDLIYTDIIGYNKLLKKLSGQKCILRILDTFGTQAVFNNPGYMKSHNIHKSVWSGHLLELKQFYTLFPHTPDNSYLGFIIEQPYVPVSYPKQNIALVYGKHISMWKGLEPFLDIFKQYFEIHATVPENGENLPKYVVNHGFLVGSEYSKLLAKSKVFIGLGFPYEGPAPLEALAYGSVFINPQLTDSMLKKMNRFFKDKPTLRRLTSQHPYIQRNVGEPYSYLVNMNDLKNLDEVCQKIVKNPLFRGVLPYEMSVLGYLERLYALVENQNFCSNLGKINYDLVSNNKDTNRNAKAPDSQIKSSMPLKGKEPKSLISGDWPPLSAAKFFMGILNDSCQTTCEKEGLVCESSYTEMILNHRLELQQRGVWCENILYESEPLHPSYVPSSSTCYFQTDHYMFSCFESNPKSMRLCGCRDFLPQQPEICKSCL